MTNFEYYKDKKVKELEEMPIKAFVEEYFAEFFNALDVGVNDLCTISCENGCRGNNCVDALVRWLLLPFDTKFDESIVEEDEAEE